MSSRNSNPDELSSRAEAQLASRPPSESAVYSSSDLLHELQINQVELELQNENLRQAYARLEEERDRYLDLYESSPVAYLTLTEQGLIKKINRTGASLFGIERQNLLQRPVASFVSQTDSERWQFFFSQLLKKNQRQTIELVLKTGNDLAFSARLDCLPVSEDKQPVVRIGLTDIPKLKQAELVPHGDEAYHQILATTLDGFWLVDFYGRLLDVNHRYTEQSGYSRAELLNMSISDLDMNENQQEIAVHMRRIIETGRDQFESVHRRKDGTLWHVEISAVYSALNGGIFYSFFRDITERKQFEAALREREFLFHTQFESGNIGIAITSPEKGWLRVNLKLCQMLGYSEAELTQLTWSEMTYLPDLEPDLLLFQRLLNGEIDNYELDKRFIRKDGDIIFTHLTVACYRAAGKVEFVIAGLLDITERKKIEAEKEQFFKFFNFARDLQCIAGSDGFFKQVNPAFSEVLGYSKDELLKTPFLELIAPEDRPATLKEVSRQSNNNQMSIDFENRYIRKDGSICWLSWKSFFNLDDQLIYAVARDVTQAKKIDEKLQLADMVYQNSIEGILITDENNQIIATNPAFSEITGYTKEDVIGKNPRIFKSGLHNAEFYQAMWQDITTQGHWQGEMWDKRKNGEIHAKFLSIKTILNKEGKIHRYLGLFSDVTARKHYEDEIRRLSDSELNKAKLEAERANRAKSDFLSSMSHELRTPMNAVLGFAQLLESEDLTEDQLDSVKEILTAGHHLMDLINEVLDLARIEAEKLEITLEKIALAELLKTCLSLVQPLLAKHEVKMINRCNDCHVCVLADRLRFKQVLLNLITNAIKYNRLGGSVTLFCDQINPQTLRFSVADTGYGLSEAQISRLFLPFERLSAKNSNIEGTGIGLLITKKLVEAMNGRIGLTSTVGEGSCFWIEMPLV